MPRVIVLCGPRRRKGGKSDNHQSRQRDVKRVGARSVYRTVCWIDFASWIQRSRGRWCLPCPTATLHFGHKPSNSAQQNGSLRAGR
jgi:hypothetical protein